MPNRAARRHPPKPAKTTARRITVNGEWYEMGEMTGRDLMFIEEIKGETLTSDMAIKVLRLIEARCQASSVPDPLDRPMSEIVEILRAWFTDTEDDALPPEIATS